MPAPSSEVKSKQPPRSIHTSSEIAKRLATDAGPSENPAPRLMGCVAEKKLVPLPPQWYKARPIYVQGFALQIGRRGIIS
jgi:hypothetical protein